MIYEVNKAAAVLVGAVIRQAVVDYRSEHVKKKWPLTWDSAKDFLFTPGRLEKFLTKYYMQDKLNCGLIRRKINTISIEEIFDE